MDQYIKLKILGMGNFGRVHLVQRKSDDKAFAMKLIALCPEVQAKNPSVEANLLKSLEHPNIVKCYETYQEEDHLCLIMEFCEKGDLLQKVKEHKKKGFYIAEEDILEWFTQLCLAIKYLHDQKILHRDIKAQNTFLTSSGIIKLGDFGISKQLDKTDEMAMTQLGTPFYLTPEMILKSTSSMKSDIWMLGCLLHELCSLQKPFMGENIPSVVNSILYEKYSEIPSQYSSFLHNLIALLLEKDEHKRPSIQYIIELPEIVEQIGLLQKKYPHIFQSSSNSNKQPESSDLKFPIISPTEPTSTHTQYPIDLPPRRKFSEESQSTNLGKEEFKSTINTPTIQSHEQYHFPEKTPEDSKHLNTTNSLVSPTSKPPLDQKKKPNNIMKIIENRKSTLSPSSQFDRSASFSLQTSTPLSIKPISSPFDPPKSMSQQQSPLIRPLPVTDEDALDSSGSEQGGRRLKRLELGNLNPNAKHPENYKKHLSINIPGPNSDPSEHPNSKGETTKTSNLNKSPIEATDPNSIPTTKTVQKKFAFSDQVFDHRSPASPNRSFWVSQFVKEKLGEEKYQRVKDLLESSANPMQVLNDQVLKIVGEENRDCIVMLTFLISHSSSSVTPTSDNTKDKESNKIFKNFDKNFKSPLSSQRLTKHTFPVNELIDSGQKSTPKYVRSGVKTPKTVLENSKSAES